MKINTVPTLASLGMATVLSARSVVAQDSSTPCAGQPQVGNSTGNAVEAHAVNSPFSAWGQEIAGLQAGLGFRAGEQRPYNLGESVRLVLRVRNVSSLHLRLRHVRAFFVEHPPQVTDRNGKSIPLLKGGVDGPHHLRKTVVKSGEEVDVHEWEIRLRPIGEGDYQPLTLHGARKFIVQSERIVGPTSGHSEHPSPALDTLATGKLELEVNEVGADEGYTVWRQELGGLQAGLGLWAGEKIRTFHPGEKVKLVVRVRNVGNQPNQFRHLSHFFSETPLVVKDSQGKPISLKGTGTRFSGKPRLATHDLTPGREADLAELTIELLPETANDEDQPWTLKGAGEYSVRYERIEGVIGPGNGNPDFLLDQMFDTGTLIFEVNDARDTSPIEGRADAPSNPDGTLLKQSGHVRVNVRSSPKFDERVFVSRAEPISGTIVDHQIRTKEVALNSGP